MLISEFDFELPPGLIAQTAAQRRDASLMLTVDRRNANLRDGRFSDLPDQLDQGDVLILNNTKVFPARLSGMTDTGSKVEVFLVDDLGETRWKVLARPGKRLRPDKTISFDGRLTARVIEKHENGMATLQFSADGDLFDIVDEIGGTPLPPYIKRDGASLGGDRERYQTVYARNRGAIAAPTAGLHFTPEILEKIRRKGVTIAEITLHVGYGTFEPVRVDDIAEHRVQPERYEISRETVEVLNTARSEGRRFVAVGTTTVRTLESALGESGRFEPGPSLAGLTITPGYRFRAVDALLTNFHLPRSSLLILTSTFGGHDLIMRAYEHAVADRYRFYSYGDCMLIV